MAFVYITYLMLTIKQCIEILKEEAKKLTDEEIEKMRNWLYEFADIVIDSYQSSQKKLKSKNQIV